jgi:Zn-dependent peptidase ImmA (M78 family)
MRDDDPAQNFSNRRKIYFTIRKKSNELHSKHDDVDYLENPSIDVKAIAQEVGIADISYVSPEEINYEHAILDDTDPDRVIIKVNKDDSEEEQLFSIAHEIEHYIKKQADMLKKTDRLKKSDIFKKADNDKKNYLFEKADVFLKPYESDKLAARGIVDKKAVQYVKKMRGSNHVAKYIAETVSEKLGKDVSVEKAYKELAKVIFIDSIRKIIIRGKSTEQFILNMVNKLYDEEMADYFAANLLVPVERFLLWEDKSDSEIAKAFKVSKACIKKRRGEIKQELTFIKSARISSGDTIIE